MKRIISILLLSSLLLSSFAACAEGQNDETDPSGETSVESTESATEAETADPTKDEFGREIIESSIAEDVDFNGTTITILLRDQLDGIEYGYEFMAEEINGEIINDSVYKRNLETEENLGIDFAYISGYGNPGDYKNVLSNSVRAQDGAYDIAAYYAYFGASWALEGLFYNLTTLDYIDFDKPWWNKNFVEECTIGDQLYAAVGDISLTSINRLYAMFFNKNLADQYCQGINFYDIVREGSWTIDKFSEIVSGLYTDTNGNGERDNDDFYGWATSASAVPVDGIQVGLGIDITARNAEGVHEYIYNSERTINAYERTLNLYANNAGVQGNPYGGKYIELCTNKFMDGSALFITNIFKETDLLRDMEDDYGVLPLYKLDETQEGYYTTSHDAYSLISITSSTLNPEASAAALEKLSETSYKYVTPSYFEVALKNKYARGNEDAEMYDIIIAGRKYNFGMVMSSSVNNVAQLWRSMLDSKTASIASNLKSTTKPTTKMLEKLIKNFDKLADKE